MNSNCKWSLSLKQVNNWCICDQSLEKMLTHAHCHCKRIHLERVYSLRRLWSANIDSRNGSFSRLENMEVYSWERPARASRSLPNLLATVPVNKPRNTTTPFFHVLNIKMQTSEMCVYNLVRRQVNFVGTRLINFNFVGKLTQV